MTEQRLVSPKQAAHYLGCTESKIRKDIFEGKIETVKIGRLVRIRIEWLEAFVRNSTRPATR
jgi:excisionase family DNA binding protein